MGKKMGKKKEVPQQRQEAKAVEATVAAANAKANIMADFPAFAKYDRKGLCLQLVSVSGADLTAEDKAGITQLLNANMAPVYGPRWASVQKQKRREMADPDARYIMLVPSASPPHPLAGLSAAPSAQPDTAPAASSAPGPSVNSPSLPPSEATNPALPGGSDPPRPPTPGVCESAPPQTRAVPAGAGAGAAPPSQEPAGGTDRGPLGQGAGSGSGGGSGSGAAQTVAGVPPPPPPPPPPSPSPSPSPVGFAHFRFVIEEDVVPVLYVYELQLRPEATGMGLGKFVMQFLELVARKNGMKGVMLTVQKSNERARNFYEKAAKFRISPTCPSFCDPLGSDDYDYEIMCKVFDQETLEKLKGSVPLTL